MSLGGGVGVEGGGGGVFVTCVFLDIQCTVLDEISVHCLS